MYRYISKDATTVNDEEIKTTAENAEAKEKHTDDKPLYEGPLSGITTRLKIVSITTASGSMLGIPYLIMTHSGDLHLMGQLAVGGAAMFGGTASTFLLNFFFGPYVHTLERVPVRNCQTSNNIISDEQHSNNNHCAAQAYLIKATTRNLLCQKIETVFDPATDVTPYKGTRPFANFVAKDKIFFVHGDMLLDRTLRGQLLPDIDNDDGLEELSKNAKEDMERDDDDEIALKR
jgi:hypothetical protein